MFMTYAYRLPEIHLQLLKRYFVVNRVLESDLDSVLNNPGRAVLRPMRPCSVP